MRFPARKSIILRLTLLFASVSTTVLLLLGLLVASLVERHFEELDVALLEGKLHLVRQVLSGTRISSELPALAARLDEALVGDHGLSLSIRTHDGRLLYAHGDASPPPSPQGEPAKLAPTPFRWRNADGGHFRGIAKEVATGFPEASPVIVTVATDLVHHEHFMDSFRTALWTVVGIAALVSGFLGWAAARQGLAPLREISRNAAAITATRLDRRLREDSIPLELGEVVKTLNEMLARLEESFRRLSDFSSDLAHELRTPLSNLLTQTQVTLSRSRSLPEYKDVLASNVEEFERLSKMIADMLFLAKADNDLVMPSLERVDLRREANGLLEFYEGVAEENGIHLSVSGQAEVAGDRLMLRRAIANLLSNAFRHTPRGGSIAVRLAVGEGGAASLAVENTGDTIPPEHLPRLFDRFYRADPARQRLGEGAGLGLAITRSILRTHGGAAEVRSEKGITRFVLSLPGGEVGAGGRSGAP